MSHVGVLSHYGHAGVPEQVSMLVTGHKTASMFRRYSVSNDKGLTEAVRLTQEYLEKLPTERRNVLDFPRASGSEQKK